MTKKVMFCLFQNKYSVSSCLVLWLLFQLSFSKFFLNESNSVVIPTLGDSNLSRAAFAITKPSAFESSSFWTLVRIFPLISLKQRESISKGIAFLKNLERFLRLEVLEKGRTKKR